MVFSWLKDLADAVSLCLVDGRFFGIGCDTVVQLQKPAFANWAGDRIICLGDYARNEDLPNSIKKIVMQDFLRWPEDPENMSFYSLTNVHYENCDAGAHFGTVPDDDRLHEDKAPFLKLFYPKSDPTCGKSDVLCNLSKKEYVRAEVLYALDRAHRIGLEQALLLRICRSSDPSMSMLTSIEFYQGAWAEDRFDVTTMSRFAATSGWKDVSDEVAKDLETIWHDSRGALSGMELVKE